MSIETYTRPMREHRAKLDGDTGSGSAAADSFGRASTTIGDLGGDHEALVRTALGGWYGQQAGVFQERAGKVKNAMTALSANSTTASTVASTATSAVTSGRTAIDNLITEFIGRATPMLEAAQTAAASGDNGRAIQAVANVRSLADEYTTKTGEALQRVRDQLTPLIGQLNGMTPVDAGALGGLGGQLGPPVDGVTTPALADPTGNGGQ
ncbi:MAG TPA: hypothetical protein VFO68_26780, partial [Actinophytocola sp.]|nr:hypothetical protein [Actinophytocola sp.]